MQERPNINQTLKSLKSAMNSSKDQILEEHYDNATAELETSVSDSAVEISSDNIEYYEDENAVFCSEAMDKDIPEFKDMSMDVPKVKDKKYEHPVIENAPEAITPPTKVSVPDSVFVLTKMIQDDGTVLNLNVPSSRPKVDISDAEMKDIIREEARPMLKEWIDKNMNKFFKKKSA